MEKLIQVVVVLIFAATPLSKAQTSNGTEAPSQIGNGENLNVVLPAIICTIVALVFITVAVLGIIACFCYWRRRRRVMKPKLEAVKVVGTEETETEAAVSVSNALSEQPSADSGTISPDRVENTDSGYEMMSPQGPLTSKEVDNGYSVLEGPKMGISKPVDNHPYYILEYINTGSVVPDYEHEYDQPFFEPSTQEEELVCQISELSVPCIPASDVELHEVLGSGQFGTVHKGVWVHEENGTEISSVVAVKTMTDGATEEDKVKFLQEAAIMGQFNQANILRIRAFVMEGDALKLVVDLMQNGDLLKHLASLKQSPSYTELTPCEQKQLLMSFSRQIVYGLGYLSFKAYVHRDLAARNVLVAEDGTCKIADFGLSRDLNNENYYKSQGGKVPVKWTAPEAINYRKYSCASDVWSYGCVLYEIWSMGQKPFIHLTNIETIKAISSGYRLPPPPGCPKPIYEFMINCWHPNPDSRPTALDICTTLQRPDYVFLKWQGNETTIYSEETRTLGEVLEKGHCMHMDLQKRHLQPEQEN